MYIPPQLYSSLRESKSSVFNLLNLANQANWRFAPFAFFQKAKNGERRSFQDIEGLLLNYRETT